MPGTGRVSLVSFKQQVLYASGVINNSDVIISAANAGGTGDIILKTKQVERARYENDGDFTYRGNAGMAIVSFDKDGHGITLDRPTGTPGDFASQVAFNLNGTTKWALGLSQEHEDFFILDGNGNNDIFTINAFNQVGIGKGTVTTTADQNARLYVNADDEPTALRLHHLTADSAKNWLQALITGDTQSRFTFTSDNSFHWGPGGSTAPNLGLSYIPISGANGPGLSLQADTDNQTSFRVLNQAGSSVFRVDTLHGVVYLKSLVQTIATLTADANLSNSQFTLGLDDTPGSAKLLIKAKNSSGTVVNGSVNLT